MELDDGPIINAHHSALYFIIEITPGKDAATIDSMLVSARASDTSALTYLELYFTDEEMERIIAAYAKRKDT